MPEVERLAAEFRDSRMLTAFRLERQGTSPWRWRIMHAYPQGGVHDNRVEITADKDRLTAQVEDDGVYFDPLRRADPDITLRIEKRSVGGLGLFFVRKVMDELSYSREAGRNRLTMVKRVTRI